jgi:Group II intron, maturase-specific domain
VPVIKSPEVFPPDPTAQFVWVSMPRPAPKRLPDVVIHRRIRPLCDAKNVKAFLDKVRETIRVNRSAKQENLIGLLNPMIRGWANYHRHVGKLLIKPSAIAGEQMTPGAPWRIRMTEELRSLFVENAPEGYVKMFKAMNLLGVSRQTILQRVKRGELNAVHVCRGRAKGIRIQIPAAHPDLFEAQSTTRG